MQARGRWGWGNSGTATFDVGTNFLVRTIGRRKWRRGGDVEML